jgi:hypothetical protein
MSRKRSTIFTAVIVLALSVLMFGRDDKLMNKGLDPGARGVVHSDKDNNGNTKFKVEVEHIATPQQLNPPHQFYVVWIQENGQAPKPVGELKVDRDHADGSVEGVTQAKVFEVFVTAEDQPTPQSPSGAELLRGNIDRS